MLPICHLPLPQVVHVPQAPILRLGSVASATPVGQPTHVAHLPAAPPIVCVLGATGNLDLFSADHPAKVLNQRVSFYRLLFAHTPAIKAAVMASLIAHR
jgi:hypothetical protein